MSVMWLFELTLVFFFVVVVFFFFCIFILLNKQIDFVASYSALISFLVAFTIKQ